MNLASLAFYIPDGGEQYILKWVSNQNLIIKISQSRKTKLGDYRYNLQTKIHQVTVNKDLNQESFFFVLTHEIAHFLTRIQFGNKIKPHGKEWKTVFRSLLIDSIEIYKPELRPVILRHAQNPKASMSADLLLHKTLFNKGESTEKMILNLKENQKFRIGKRIFQKGQKRKIRYLCKEISTGKMYTISGHTIADEIYEK